jgi:N-acetylglutamate synthase-like GNAT family acetyltransferase
VNASLPIRPAHDADFARILAIINEAAQAYRGVIPPDRWHEPYMPADELTREIADGVSFWVTEQDGQVVGVMGIQDKGDVALVRHAYVASTTQRGGVGTRLLHHVRRLVDKPVLIGTWAAAAWAIGFYRRNGFHVVSHEEKERLLRTYWSIPARQVETSVVLADPRWSEEQMRAVLVGPDAPAIVAFEARLRRAQLDADVATLDLLISDDLLFTGPDGQLGTKAQDLAAHGSGVVRFRAHEPEELRIRRIGSNVAVVALRTRLAVEVNATLVRGTYRYTRVWARESDGAWRVVGGHVSEVPVTTG